MSALLRTSGAAGGLRVTVAGVELGMPPLQSLAVPVIILMILAMMILPLRPIILDLLFSFNIALSIVVLLVATYTVRPLDFAVFPTVLLVTTLLRLSLNVASTRAVLMHGHTGTDAAGSVIEAFAKFVVGGNFAVGIIVFAILTVINFIVVTKGAGRIAEVSARFALDAMPGKQMAIDADLNAGVIDQEQARQRRAEVSMEADFFGSMDGASKFVRGDAVAGMIILAINVIGGLVIGVVQHDFSMSQAASNYVLMAIGDALVAQVPALVISVAAGMIVSRVGNDDDVGGQLGKQLFDAPRALGIAAFVVALLGSVPGMPHMSFLALAGGCAWLAWRLQRDRKRAQDTSSPESEAPVRDHAEASWEDVSQVDALGLEVGYRLITLVDKERGAELLGRIKGVRKKFAQEVGFLPPAVHICDNLQLSPSTYRLTLKGAVVGEAEVHPGMLMAIDPGQVTQKLAGPVTTDPAFGLPAVWIEPEAREQAQIAGYTVVDAATVIATHLHHLMQMHASRLLGRNETQHLLEHMREHAPKLVEEVIPGLVPVAVFQRVLQNLLEEAVHVRDLFSILETLGEHGQRTQDAAELTVEVRRAIGPALVQQVFGPTAELDVIALEPELEGLLLQTLAAGSTSPLEPGVADFVARGAAAACEEQESRGVAGALLVPDAIRQPLFRLVRKAAPRLHVLGHAEIPETNTVRIGKIIGEAS